MTDTTLAALQLRAKMRMAQSGFESRLHASLGPGRVAVDVGAHIGMISALYAERFETVWAIEPNPTLADRLRSTFDRMGLDNVRVNQVAVSDAPGKATLSVPRYHGRSVGSLGSLLPSDSPSDTTSFEVDVVTLDDLIDGPIDVLKVDAEGVEVEVLAGADRLLGGQPIVIVESEERHRPGAPLRVRQLLESYGLAGLILLEDRITDASDFDPTAHADLSPSLLGDVPDDYVENYIYVPADDR